MNRLFTLGMILTSLTFFSGFTCGPPVILDTGFDLWCGDYLCAWEVDDGWVEQVPTWHRSDFGAELVGNPASISQLALKKISCVEFMLQVDRDEDATVYIEMDFQNDGSFEYSHPIASTDFKPAHYFITPPRSYQSVRFQIRKVGPGRAVLARVEVRDGDGCVDPPIDLGDRPKGAQCETDRECLSNSCLEIAQYRFDIEDLHVKSCGGCKSHSDCTGDQVCGLEYGSQMYLYQDCGLPERHRLGERCVSNEECTNSICCERVCSECCGEDSCPVDTLCEIRDLESLGEEYDGQIFPYQCSPGTGKGLAGAPCLLDDDCESNQCLGLGPFRTCFLDGRKCLTDEDCTLWATCLPLGVAGGKCQ